jgi:hypothetical protein
MQNFREEQERIREELEPLLSIAEVRNILGVSKPVVLRLIESGDIESFDVYGKYVTTNQLMNHNLGIRILPSSVQSYLERMRVS